MSVHQKNRNESQGGSGFNQNFEKFPVSYRSAWYSKSRINFETNFYFIFESGLTRLGCILFFALNHIKNWLRMSKNKFWYLAQQLRKILIFDFPPPLTFLGPRPCFDLKMPEKWIPEVKKHALISNSKFWKKIWNQVPILFQTLFDFFRNQLEMFKKCIKIHRKMASKNYEFWHHAHPLPLLLAWMLG